MQQFPEPLACFFSLLTFPPSISFSLDTENQECSFPFGSSPQLLADIVSMYKNHELAPRFPAALQLNRFWEVPQAAGEKASRDQTNWGNSGIFT